VTLYGVVDVQKLQNKVTAIGIDEGANQNDEKDVQRKVTMKAGEL